MISAQAKTTGLAVTMGSAEAAPSAEDNGEIRRVRYPHAAHDGNSAQISLKPNDLVRIFDVTDSDWAAGVRIDKATMQEVGEAGWFPVSYLFPPEPTSGATLW